MGGLCWELWINEAWGRGGSCSCAPHCCPLLIRCLSGGTLAGITSNPLLQQMRKAEVQNGQTTFWVPPTQLGLELWGF